MDLSNPSRYLLIWRGYYYPEIMADYIYGVFDSRAEAETVIAALPLHLKGSRSEYEILEFVSGKISGELARALSKVNDC